MRATGPGEQSRVTVVVSHLSPTLGMERAALRLVEALDDHFAVEVVSLAGGAGDHALRPGVRTASATQLRGWRRALTLVRARRLLAHDDAAVRLFVGAPAALAGLLVTRPTDRDVVWEHSLSTDRVRRSLALRLVWTLLRTRYAKVRTIVAVSPVVADLVREAGCADVRVVPNMLADEPSPDEVVERRARVQSESSDGSDSPDGDRVELVSVGTLSRLKNHAAVITALAELPPHVHLTIVGDGPLRAELEQHAEALGVALRVTFTGRVSAAEVQDRMRTSTLLVHASSSETFGLVYVEAAAAGLPVLTTDHATARWLVPRYVPGLVTSPIEIAEGIRRLLAEPPGTDETERSAAERRRDFDSRTTARTWSTLLQEIASTRETSA